MFNRAFLFLLMASRSDWIKVLLPYRVEPKERGAVWVWESCINDDYSMNTLRQALDSSDEDDV